jgi:hypothetical protein
MKLNKARSNVFFTCLDPLIPLLYGKPKTNRSSLFEQTDRDIQQILLLFCQAVPLITELIGVFDIPNHNKIIASMGYNSQPAQPTYFSKPKVSYAT